MAEVSEVREASAEVLAAVNRLLPELSARAQPLCERELAEMLSSSAEGEIGTHLFMSDDGLGMASLVIFRCPTGLRAVIEDVVVATSARGRGLGAKLVEAALDRARSAGLRDVDLTSRPSRESANRLYRRLGFAARDTNVYRYDLQS